MVFLLLVYIRTDPITLPCSLARTGNNKIILGQYLFLSSNFFTDYRTLSNLNLKLKTCMKDCAVAEKEFFLFMVDLP